MAAFLVRLSHSFLVGALLIGLSLALGISGYNYFKGLPLTDSFLNASMILGGMPPRERDEVRGGQEFRRILPALFRPRLPRLGRPVVRPGRPPASSTVSTTALRKGD
jgi:hypothetical protein